jgi:hypothetical protein
VAAKSDDGKWREATARRRQLGTAMCSVPRRLQRIAQNNYNEILPTQISLNITQSPIRLYNGWRKVAGRFFSKKKCPTHANP